MNKIFIGLVVFCLMVIATKAEDLNINVGAYVDTYIATDNDKILRDWDNSTEGVINRQFSLQDNLKDEFDLNLAQISAKIGYKNIMRAVVTIQSGRLPEITYGKFNPSIQEANLGYQLFNNFWVDAGYFLTHIGGESYQPKNNWLSSISMLTYFEPVYQAGVKLSYETEKITAALHILNGNGIFIDNNENKSFGLYFAYHNADKMSLSYAGIYGNEETGNPKNSKMHLYHNISFETYPNDNFGIKAQLDYATLEKGTFDNDNLPIDGSFMGFSLQGRYKITTKTFATVRFSYFDNLDNIYDSGRMGWNGMGLTGGLEYKPTGNSYLRLEARLLDFNEGDENLGFPGNVFFDGKDRINSRTEILLNFGAWIN